MNKLKPKIVVICILNYFKEEKLLILISKVKISILAIKKIDVAIIDIDVYCIACKSKKARVFAISRKNLKYQAQNKARPEINPKNVILKEYHDLLDVFFKKNLDIFLSYQKYNHKIILEKE